MNDGYRKLVADLEYRLPGSGKPMNFVNLTREQGQQLLALVDDKERANAHVRAIVTPTISRLHICDARLFARDQKAGVFPAHRELPKCPSLASFKIGEKHYCRRHAAMKVFDMAMGDDDGK